MLDIRGGRRHYVRRMHPLCRVNLIACTIAVSVGARSLGAQESAPPPPQPPAEPAQASESPAPSPDEAILVLRDGRRIMGILVGRTSETITLRIAGIDTEFPASTVDRFQVLPPVLERYNEMRAAIDPSDMQQMLRLVEWLRARERYDLALAEVDRALDLTPGNSEALRARALITGQMELAAKAGKGQGRTVAPPPAAPESPAPRKPFPVLTPEQINVIKVFEVDLKDPPNLMIKRDAITRLMTEHAGNPLIPSTAEGRDAMYRQNPAAILDTMFRLQARNLYPQVQVIGQPRSMRLFRDDVHRTWLVNGCATARCHGGEEAGRLQLATQKPSSDETVYTNFLILDRYRLPSGIGLMNYEDPVRSPLLQAGLPREDALYPHPVVPGPNGRGDLWRPVFQSTRDSRYQQAMEWIRSMYRPRPDYPIDYTPPRPSVAPPPPGQQADGRR
ncbi:MAG: hypothetical protein IT437_09670 [Phycisphaerales bacterium]|nr:hypothetical protein [Phycisphaerales bacterium]